MFINITQQIKRLFKTGETDMTEHEEEIEQGKVDECDNHTVVLSRVYHKNGAHGILTFPSGNTLMTAERPWMGNKRSVSCIPEGVYDVGLRPSPVVSRTTRGRYKKGWEVRNVEGRSYIMFHPGNWPLKDSDGCILPGMSQDFNDHQPVVWRSQEAMDKFMKWMKSEKIEKIVIKKS